MKFLLDERYAPITSQRGNEQSGEFVRHHHCEEEPLLDGAVALELHYRIGRDRYGEIQAEIVAARPSARVSA